MSQTTAEQAMAELTRERKEAFATLHQLQCDRFQDQAEQALHEVILPWWNTFRHSAHAAQLGLLAHNSSGQFARHRISDNVRHLHADGTTWEAFLVIEGRPRNQQLYVEQYRDGRPPSSMASAMHSRSKRRTIPTDGSGLADLDLHPIVIVDLAEQIKTNVVTAHVLNVLAKQAER